MKLFSQKQDDIAVLGIGNLILSDEGFGIHVIRALNNYKFDPPIKLIDGGTAGTSLINLIDGIKRLIVVDCIDIDKPCGSIFVFDKKDIANAPGIRFSPHQIGFLDVLDLLAMRDKAPLEIKFIGVVGKKFSPSLELSETLQNVLPKVCRLVLELLKEFNVEVISKKKI